LILSRENLCYVSKVCRSLGEEGPVSVLAFLALWLGGIALVLIFFLGASRVRGESESTPSE